MNEHDMMSSSEWISRTSEWRSTRAETNSISFESILIKGGIEYQRFNDAKPNNVSSYRTVPDKILGKIEAFSIMTVIDIVARYRPL